MGRMIRQINAKIFNAKTTDDAILKMRVHELLEMRLNHV